MARNLRQAADEFDVPEVELRIEDPDPDVTYRLRALTRETYKQTVKAHTRRGPMTRAGQPTEVVDGPGIAEDLLDHALVGWSGILVGGEPAPCTRETKLLLDPVIADRLIDRAGRSEIVGQEARRPESFRPTEGLRD